MDHSRTAQYHFPDKSNNEKYNSLFDLIEALESDPAFTNPNLERGFERVEQLFFDYATWLRLILKEYGGEHKGVSNTINAFSLIISIAVIKYANLLDSSNHKASSTLELGLRANVALTVQRANVLLEGIKPMVFDQIKLNQLAVAKAKIDRAHLAYLS